MLDLNNDNALILFRQAKLFVDVERKKGTPVSIQMLSEKSRLTFGMLSELTDGIKEDDLLVELIKSYIPRITDEGGGIEGRDPGHIKWLTEERMKDWHFWARYKEYLNAKIPDDALDELDRSTNQILGYLEDPRVKFVKGEDGKNYSFKWDRRGLVMGHVQSGKTGNYTGLICKAADAGFKIIIVLAGLHNNLRAQTQIRLDDGFLGYSTDTKEPSGVGLIDPSLEANSVTTRLERGDFNTKLGAHVLVTPENNPWLFVVKKNKTVLFRLLKWLIESVAKQTFDEKSVYKDVISKFPLLIIDDEADHGSVDTGDLELDADGKPIEEHNPTALNSLIRKILLLFTRSAYVGYTATPFANIFIHEKAETREEGPDLFPKDFIYSLATPPCHIGPRFIFGTGKPDEKLLSIVRNVDDADTWLPPKHKSTASPAKELPKSLKDAILSFMITVAVRALRGQGKAHSSMLIHATRYVSVQGKVAKAVNEYFNGIKKRLLRGISDDEIVNDLRNLWEHDKDGYVAVNREAMEMLGVEYGINQLPSFDDMKNSLLTTVKEIVVMQINGSAKEVLDYENNKKNGLKVIAVGGDKLSRGLTLEGLSVSYFLRQASMYDTLMQMGRWFGYRPGYVDLCRLYIPAILSEWYRHISAASEELRAEFDLAVARNKTPREFGLKVQSHPSMMITSRVKMRAAKEIQISFSGQRAQTIVFYKNSSKIALNWENFCSFTKRLGIPQESPIKRNDGDKEQKWSGMLWKGVPSGKVIDFLSHYACHPAAYRIDSGALTDYIKGMNALETPELTSWDVAVLGIVGGTQREIPGTGQSIGLATRSDNSMSDIDRYSIGVLTGPMDECIWLDDSEWESAMDLTRELFKKNKRKNAKEPEFPSGPAIRQLRECGDIRRNIPSGRERGLLMIYLLENKYGDGDCPVVGFSLSFPGSPNSKSVTYKVNHVLWENGNEDAE